MGLTGEEYTDLLVAESADLTLPPGPRRRTGADRDFTSALDDVRQSLAVRRRSMHEGHVPHDVYAAGVETGIELASILYAAGAPHPVWRRFAALAATGLLAAGDPATASVWAVLSRDAQVARRVPAAPPGLRPIPRNVIWRLAAAQGEKGQEQGGADTRAGGDTGDEVDLAWQVLARSIPTRDTARIDSALREITDFWLSEIEDWEEFHPRYYPDFDPEVAAVAGLAARAGWRPDGLAEDARRYLEPGLAPGDPRPLPDW